MQRLKEIARGASPERKLASLQSAIGNGNLEPSAHSEAQVTGSDVKARDGNQANDEKRTATEHAEISFTSYDSAVVEQDPEKDFSGNDKRTVASGIYSLLEDHRNKLTIAHDTSTSPERENEKDSTSSPSTSDDFATMRQCSSLAPPVLLREGHSESFPQREANSLTRAYNEDDVKCEQDDLRYPHLRELLQNNISQAPASIKPGSNIVKLDTTPWGMPVAPAAHGEATSLLAGLEASEQAIASLDNDQCTLEMMNSRHSLPAPSARVRSVSEETTSAQSGRRHSSLRPAVRFSSTVPHSPDAVASRASVLPRVSMALPPGSIRVERRRSTPVRTSILPAVSPGVHLGARREASVGHSQTLSLQLRKTPSRISLARLFPARAEQWGAGVRAGLLYAPEAEHDGHGSRGLRATLLAGLSAQHAPETLVRRGDTFTVRVVGTHLPRVRRGFVRVAYSAARAKGWGKDASASVMAVHVGCAGDGTRKDGYKAVPHGDSLVAAGQGGVRVLAARFVLAETRQGATEPTAPVAAVEAAVRSRGTRAVDEEIAWEIGEDGDTMMRRGALALRFGYYFVLGEPSAARLYCAASTPEHVRLVALAGAGGGERREVPGVSRMLTYVVIRVSEA